MTATDAQSRLSYARRRRPIALLGGALVLPLIVTAVAFGATGALTYQGCISGDSDSGPSGTNACAAIPSAASSGSNSGLDELARVAVSPDGKSVYAVSDGNDAISGFDRDATTGAITYQGCITGDTASGPSGSGACAVQIPKATSTGANSGLDLPFSVAVSPDGKSVYLGSFLDDAVARFDRDATTGALTYAGCITGESESGPAGTSACSAITSATGGGVNSGLDGIKAVIVSPDGKSVYAGTQNDTSVVRFDRDVNGALMYQGCITGEDESGTACTQIPSHQVGGDNSGLRFVSSLSVPPDGKSLYAAVGADDAVARFNRDTGTGALTYQDCLSGETESGMSGSGACTLIPAASSSGTNSGLNNPRVVAASPDNNSVYVGTEGDEDVARFNRDTGTGALSYQGCVTGKSNIGPSGTNACSGAVPGATSGGGSSGLNVVDSVAVSADGKSLYSTGSGDDAVDRFDRDPTTGALSFAGCFSGDTSTGPAGTNACTLIPSATVNGTNSGLNGDSTSGRSSVSLALSADGKSLYTASTGDDAVARFDREPEPPVAPPSQGGGGGADTTPPNSKIGKHPKKKTTSHKAKFTFSSTEPGSSFKCKLDRKPFKPCSSPFSKRVKARKHTFQVDAIDAAGNVDPTPAKFKWKVLAP